MFSLPAPAVRLACLVLFACPALRAEEALPSKPVPEAEAMRIGWPGLAGPYGTFEAVPITTPLVSDLSKARKLWESETRDLGRTKGESTFYRNVAGFTQAAIEKNRAHPGSWSGPVIGNNTIFAASWRPVGPFVEVAGSKVRLDAEDIVVAIDPDTGKTKWIAAEPGGMLTGGGKRQGFYGGPVYHRGVIYSFGSTGRLFAHDAATGKKRWESEAHPQRAEMKAAREERLAGLAAGKFSYKMDPDVCGSLAVIGGVLIAPTQEKGGGSGLIGIDLQTGALKWSAPKVISRWATPATWRQGGKEHLLTGNERGELRLIDPTTGRELWKLAGFGPMWPTLIPGKTHVLVNGRAGSGQQKGGIRLAGDLVAVRLSPEKGERDWSAPRDYRFSIWMDRGARERILYREGRFLLLTTSVPHSSLEVAAGGGGEVGTKAEDKKAKVLHSSPAYLLDEATGKVVAQWRSGSLREDDLLSGVAYWQGDRLISRGDSFHGWAHGGRHPWLHWSIQGGRIEQLQGKMDLADFTTGYDVAIEVPLVAGRMFERLANGGIACYDLRQETP